MYRILTAILTALGIMSTYGCGDDTTLQKAREKTKPTSTIGSGAATCQTF